MSGGLAGRKVFVTGASRGIGLAIAAAFREEGAYVIGTRTGPASAATAPCQEWVNADFSRLDQIDACAEQVRRLEPDVLVNNAGINRIAPFVEISASDFLLIHQVNVLAPFRLCQAAVPAMKVRGWGRIVNMSSVWGKVSKPQRASYSASKFAIDGLTAAIAAEHTQHGILANCIAPGFIDTELTRSILSESERAELASHVPARRLGRAEEIAATAAFLASDDASFVTGSAIAVDGGLLAM
ncbi:MAG TPA: SDR family NAD(P)-dependent oxidoreductase [Vicinamibacterales bacterium]